MPDDPRKLERAFWSFHHDNPHVYDLLVRLAREWQMTRGGGLGMKMLYERARWEVAVTTTTSDDYTLNNNFTAFYARLIMECEPDLAGVFKLRRQKTPSTFGGVGT